MNIVLFTSAMIEDEFAEYQSKAEIKPNPSNQNFYAKLIKALSFRNNVCVVSHRPLVKGMFEDDFLQAKQSSSGKVKYFYTPVECSKSYKAFREVKEIIETAEIASKEFRSEGFIVVTDTLRTNLLIAAKKFAKKHHVKIVGVLTDNPANLSSVRAGYVRKILKNANDLNGYLALSSGLLRAFKVSSKPNYIFEGLVDEVIQTKKQPIGNYYFFGGALYERYGVKKLINAFIKANVEEKLVIAGNGPVKEYIYQSAEKHNCILYLSQLPKDKVYGLEQNAIANINPRPYTRKLDEESVPSKLLEYLASGVPTISTMHSKLFEIFKEDVYWILDDSQDGIRKAIEDFSKEEPSVMKRRATTARLKVYELYGVKEQGERITYFLETVSVSLNK